MLDPRKPGELERLRFWRAVDGELKKLGESEPSQFGCVNDFYDAGTSASEAAMKIRAQRIRASHAEEGDDI